MSVYLRTGKCDKLWPLHRRVTFAFNGQGVWIPHGLSQNHKIKRVVIWTSLLARHRLAREQRRPFLSCIVTGDERWCLYTNIKKSNVPISPLGTSFSSVHCSTHYLQMTKRQYINSSIGILNFKQKCKSINKHIATGIPRRWTNSLMNYAPT